MAETPPTAPDAAGPPLQWRPADGDRAREARILALAVLDATGEPVDADEARRLPDALRRDGGEFWVLSVKGVTVGTLGLRPEGGGIFALCWWTVAGGHRRIGLGEWQLERALDWARGVGARAVRAAARPDNVPALAALRALGFHPDPDAPDAPGPDAPRHFVRRI